ncbi:hypothetical protein [Prevotella illustrans]|nr:hypothetical protein [Prevotella illustrans]
MILFYKGLQMAALFENRNTLARKNAKIRVFTITSLSTHYNNPPLFTLPFNSANTPFSSLQSSTFTG